jgi:hypothetical protein
MKKQWKHWMTGQWGTERVQVGLPNEIGSEIGRPDPRPVGAIAEAWPNRPNPVTPGLIEWTKNNRVNPNPYPHG